MYRDSKQLKIHVDAVHYKLKRLKCRYCESWFVYRVQRRRHEKKFHPGVGGVEDMKMWRNRN